MLSASESEFVTRPAIALLEGLSVARSNTLRRGIVKENKIGVPHMGKLAVDRTIKQALFTPGSSRDSRTDILGMLATRRAAALQVLGSNTRFNGILLRMHLLSSYSSLRDDSTTVDQWLDAVAFAFGDMLPQQIIYLDQRDRHGIEHSPDDRDLESTRRDNDRRVDALDAMVRRWPRIQTLYVPYGQTPEAELAAVLNHLQHLPYTR